MTDETKDEPKSGEPKSGEPKSDEPKPATEATESKVEAAAAKPPDDAAPTDEAKPDAAKAADENKPAEVKPIAETKLGDTKPAAEPKPAVEAKPDEPKPAVEAKPDEPKPAAETKPHDAKAAVEVEPTADAKPAAAPIAASLEDSHATDATPSTSDYRVIAIVLAFASIACLGYAVWSRQWLYNPRTVVDSGEYGIGPRGVFRCIPDKSCEDMSNSELVDDFAAKVADVRRAVDTLPADSNQDSLQMARRQATDVADTLHTSSAFVPFGQIALVSIIVTIASLLVTLGLALAGKRVLLPIQPTTTALLGLMVGLIAGCVFVATKPGAAGFVGVSYGFWVFGAGSVFGLAAATLLNKHIRPLDLDLLEDSMDPEQF